MVLNKKTHEAGVRSVLETVYNSTLHDQLQKYIPFRIQGVQRSSMLSGSKTNGVESGTKCFLQTVISSIDLHLMIKIPMSAHK